MTIALLVWGRLPADLVAAGLLLALFLLSPVTYLGDVGPGARDVAGVVDFVP